jgi:hypothetical protein
MIDEEILLWIDTIYDISNEFEAIQTKIEENTQYADPPIEIQCFRVEKLITYMLFPLYSLRVAEKSSRHLHPTCYQNELAMRNTTDVRVCSHFGPRLQTRNRLSPSPFDHVYLKRVSVLKFFSHLLRQHT